MKVHYLTYCEKYTFNPSCCISFSILPPQEEKPVTVSDMDAADLS